MLDRQLKAALHCYNLIYTISYLEFWDLLGIKVLGAIQECTNEVLFFCCSRTGADEFWEHCTEGESGTHPADAGGATQTPKGPAPSPVFPLPLMLVWYQLQWQGVQQPHTPAHGGGHLRWPCQPPWHSPWQQLLRTDQAWARHGMSQVISLAVFCWPFCCPGCRAACHEVWELYLCFPVRFHCTNDGTAELQLHVNDGLSTDWKSQWRNITMEWTMKVWKILKVNDVKIVNAKQEVCMNADVA